jgi:hypothetical protein
MEEWEKHFWNILNLATIETQELFEQFIDTGQEITQEIVENLEEVTLDYLDLMATEFENLTEFFEDLMAISSENEFDSESEIEDFNSFFSSRNQSENSISENLISENLIKVDNDKDDGYAVNGENSLQEATSRVYNDQSSPLIEDELSSLEDAQENNQNLFNSRENFFNSLSNLEDMDLYGTPRIEPSSNFHGACIGCKYYHGHVYGRNLLVCGMHPYGWHDDNCPDFADS